MSCFDNFIGVRAECLAEAPKSGLYIEDLEGISLEAAAAVATEQTGLALLKEKILFASKQAISDALSALPVLTTNTIAESLRFWAFTTTNESGQPGQEITKSPFSAKRANLVASRAIIKTAMDAPGAVFTVTDGQNLLYSETLDLFAGIEKEVDFWALSTTGKLNAAISGTPGYYLAPSLALAWQSGISSCCSRPCESSYLVASDGRGVVLDVNLVCDTDKAACEILPIIKDAVLYRAGMEVLKEWIATDRLNFLAVNGQEWAGAKIEEWTGIYWDKLRNAMTPRTVQNIIKGDNICFDCGGNKFGYSK